MLLTNISSLRGVGWTSKKETDAGAAMGERERREIRERGKGIEMVS